MVWSDNDTAPVENHQQGSNTARCLFSNWKLGGSQRRIVGKCRISSKKQLDVFVGGHP